MPDHPLNQSTTLFRYIFRIPWRLVAKAFDIVKSKFELPIRYCIPFQINTLGKGIGLFMPSLNHGLIVPQLFFYPIYQPLRSDRIWHKVNF